MALGIDEVVWAKAVRLSALKYPSLTKDLEAQWEGSLSSTLDLRRLGRHHRCYTGTYRAG
jgi:hypothetical protein